MTFQQLVVIAIILVAVFFAVSKMMAKRKSFSTHKGDCGKDDCGCGS
ncbi:MAG: FeoB-associated Cys-rich membrane protein [Pyrinomonadaceae bacterium]